MIMSLIVIGVMIGLVTAMGYYAHSQRDSMFDRINEIPEKDIYY
jgi:hypothetical protein